MSWSYPGWHSSRFAALAIKTMQNNIGIFLMCHMRATGLVTHACFSLLISEQGPVQSCHMQLTSFQHLTETVVQNLDLN